jgi:hypothetical protein
MVIAGIFLCKSVEALEVVMLPSVSNNAVLCGIVNCAKCITQMYNLKPEKYCSNSSTGH